MRLLAIVCLVSITTFAQEPAAQKEVLSAHKSYWDAFIRGDGDTMRTVETADAVIIADGVMASANPNRFANITKRGPIPGRTQTPDVQRFGTLGNGQALLAGFIDMKVGAQAGRTPFTEVWVKEQDRWRLKVGHYSRFMPASSTTEVQPNPDGEKAADPALRAAIRQRDDAIRKRDAAAWGAVVSDHHLQINPNGVVLTKAARMKALSAPGPGTGTFLESQEERFFPHGPNVVIYTYTEGAGGARTRFTETWVKEPSGWKLAVRQGTFM